MRTGPDGAYSVRGLAPGNYKLTVIDPEDAESLKLRGSLGIYEEAAEKVHVNEADKLIRDLKL